MSSTKNEPSAELAASFFDEVLTPLAQARRSAGKPPYFPLKEEASTTSYFVPAPLKVMRPEDFELRIGDKAEALIDDLCRYWTEHGDTALVAMGPSLKKVAEALSTEAAENDGRVDILCYTLF